jgi:hypothetical protein
MIYRLVAAAGLSLIASSFALATESRPTPEAKPASAAAAAAARSGARIAMASPVPQVAETGAAAAPAKPEAGDPRQQRLAALQSLATRTSLKYLPRLRPYASNYSRLVNAVLGYWRRHTANPSAEQLTDLIMHHVKDEYRFFARPQILAGVSEGVAALRAELHKL